MTTTSTYVVIPERQGVAVGKHQWAHVLEWMVEKEGVAHSFALDWHVDADTLQNYYDADLKADRFYDKVTGKTCDCCGEEIGDGQPYYMMTYNNMATQEPLCYKCATEALEGEVIEATDAANVPLAQVILDQMKQHGLNVRHWTIMAWMIAQRLDSRTLTAWLDRNGVSENLRQKIVFNQPLEA